MNVEQIRSVFLGITYQCNQRCRFCYAMGNIENSPKHGDIETLIQIIGKLSESRVIDNHTVIHLTGGEPTLHEHLIDVIEHVKTTTQFKVSLISNGVKLSDKSFVSKLISKGIDSIQISVEGLENTHEKLTQLPGSWEKCIKGLTNVLEYKFSGISVSTNTTICSINRDDILNLAEFMVNQLDINRMSFNGITLDVWKKNEQYILSYSEITEILEHLKIFSELYNAEFRYLMPIPYCIQKNRNIIPTGGCGAAHSQININPDGTITPCPQFANKIIGNVIKDDLDLIWKNNSVLKSLRNLNYLPEACNNCIFKTKCKGACPVVCILNSEKFSKEIIKKREYEVVA